MFEFSLISNSDLFLSDLPFFNHFLSATSTPFSSIPWPWCYSSLNWNPKNHRPHCTVHCSVRCSNCLTQTTLFDLISVRSDLKLSPFISNSNWRSLNIFRKLYILCPVRKATAPRTPSVMWDSYVCLPVIKQSPGYFEPVPRRRRFQPFHTIFISLIVM